MAGYLIADIGGTHSRLALAGDGIRHIQVYDNAGYPGPDAVIREYLDTLDDEAPGAAAIAVASPVDGDTATMTNLGWSFSADDLRARFGFN
ncbi:MAG: glucokinase, partial [Gammaproteobacteria bacterium]